MLANDSCIHIGYMLWESSRTAYQWFRYRSIKWVWTYLVSAFWILGIRWFLQCMQCKTICTFYFSAEHALWMELVTLFFFFLNGENHSSSTQAFSRPFVLILLDNHNTFMTTTGIRTRDRTPRSWNWHLNHPCHRNIVTLLTANLFLLRIRVS